MFSKAYKIVSRFTLPTIVSMRLFDGTVECIIAAMTVLNREGWAITTAHLFEPFFAYKQHRQEVEDYKERVKAIENNPNWDAKKKRRRKSRLQSNPKWITSYSYWWGHDGVRDSELRLLPEGDLAIVRLEPFNPDSIPHYPVIKNPANLENGTSLCKLGFPFHAIRASFDEETKNFTLEPGALPVPRFPIEGIYTRWITTGRSKDDKYEIKFIETSSPGLKGQSGGPVFDVSGTVWGIQSKTINLPLGFSPKIVRNGKEVEENQFLNVGWAIHPELLVSFLKDQNIDFEMSEY